MKKIIILVLIAATVASCAKKMAPTTTQAPSSNNGSVILGNTTSTPSSNQQKLETATTATSVATNADATPTGSKQGRGTGELSIEQKGQAIFNAKCGSCHGFKVTTDYTANRWITVMQVMAVKANLSDVEKENVLAYVKANAKK